MDMKHIGAPSYQPGFAPLVWTIDTIDYVTYSYVVFSIYVWTMVRYGSSSNRNIDFNSLDTRIEIKMVLQDTVITIARKWK